MIMLINYILLFVPKVPKAVIIILIPKNMIKSRNTNTYSEYITMSSILAFTKCFSPTFHLSLESQINCHMCTSPSTINCPWVLHLSYPKGKTQRDSCLWCLCPFRAAPLELPHWQQSPINSCLQINLFLFGNQLQLWLYQNDFFLNPKYCTTLNSCTGLPGSF